jgi:hypothetical protein
MWPELDMISVESADARQSTASGLETVTLTGIDQTANVDSPSHRRLVRQDPPLEIVTPPGA